MATSLPISAVICGKLSRVISNLHFVEVKLGRKSAMKTFCSAFGVYQILTIAYGVTKTALLMTMASKGITVYYVLHYFHLCIFVLEQLIVCFSICLRKLLQLTKYQVLKGEIMQQQVFYSHVCILHHSI
jgi:hypothetical protein